MRRVTVWQCKDDCCVDKPFSDKYWLARSRDFEFYQQVSTFDTAISLTDWYVRSLK